MQRFRSTSFAVVGGALLLVLTVSGVFGARGQSESPSKPFGLDVAFVLAMLDEQDEEVDEDEEQEEHEVDEDEEQNEEEQNEEEQNEEEQNEDPETVEEDPETLEEEVEDNDNPTDNHGACVSAVARSDAVGGWQNNHGGAVSEAARYTCWGLEPPDNELGELEEPEDSFVALAGDGRGKSTAFERMGGRWSWTVSDDTDEQAGPGKGKGQAKGENDGPAASAKGGGSKGSANKGKGHGRGR
jgi:hypothetical protein